MLKSDRADTNTQGDVIKRLELKKYKWGRNLIKMEFLLGLFSPNTIQLIGFVEILMKIFIYLKILKILKFLISSLLNLANGPVRYESRRASEA